MFQINQAFQLFEYVTGGQESFIYGQGWIFGVIMAILVGVERNFITREQALEFSVENLTSEVEVVETLFALPFSEQEDLEIGAAARPAPDLIPDDDKRGVGQWNLELSAGEKASVRISVGMTWPEGFELFWRP